MPNPTYASPEISLSSAVNNDMAQRYALSLTQFSGEIFASFTRKKVLSNLIKTRFISSGKTAQFPFVGRAKASYHTTGTEVNLTGIKSAQRTITVPGVITSAHFIDEFEELVMHYSLRSEYSKEMGEALCNLREEHVAMMLALASHGTKVIDDADQVDGRFITNDKFKFGTGGSATKVEQAAAFCEAIYMANVAMDEANVPEEGRHCALRSKEFYSLLEGINGVAGYAVNREYGGMGSFADGTLPKIGNVSIVRANAIPKANIPKDTGNYRHYYGDFSKLAGLVFTTDAVGCVELMGVTVDTEKKASYLAELVLAKCAYGLGILRPECSVALELDTLTN